MDKYKATHIQCSFCNLARGNPAGQGMMSLTKLCIFEMAMATDKGAEVKPDCEERPSPLTSLMTILRNTAIVRLL